MRRPDVAAHLPGRREGDSMRKPLRPGEIREKRANLKELPSHIGQKCYRI